MAEIPKPDRGKYAVLFETSDGVKILEPKVKPSHFEDKGGGYKESDSSTGGKDKANDHKRRAG